MTKLNAERGFCWRRFTRNREDKSDYTATLKEAKNDRLGNNDPHVLADVEIGVVRAQFGAAESAAVWLTQEDLILDGLGFLSQHLIVLLDPEQIVANMHEAYCRIQLDLTAYGCFMMGPPAFGIEHAHPERARTKSLACRVAARQVNAIVIKVKDLPNLYLETLR